VEPYFGTNEFRDRLNSFDHATERLFRNQFDYLR
jgi:hypothetical protein